jgi:hypothetical protein
MNTEIAGFIDRYVKEIKENNAVVFLGAGFSKKSGFVNWKELLKDIAKELSLNIEKETDLVALAQYHCNKNGNRAVINNIIFEEFSQEKEPSENHRILARLPIFTYWTTNYDSLIEDSLKEAHKKVDVKSNTKQLSNTMPHRDAIVYKMHGDKSNPNDTVIVKDDYESYYRKYAPFITALNGDLISKTFLFIGFSLTDPNLDYILSRVRVEYAENPRQHYAIIKKVNIDDFQNRADYEYEARKQELFIDDLKRYKIKALLIEEYSEITDILMAIEKRINHDNIFISGSAEDYGSWGKGKAIEFINDLSKRLIKENYDIISGFGVGVGSYVITGALEQIYLRNKVINDDRLVLRPFPQGIEDEEKRNTLWKKYRQDMISRAGISIFIFGNKKDSNTNEIIDANGVRSEFKIAREQGNILIPVGVTGFMATELWDIINNSFSDFYPKASQTLRCLFAKLNEETDKDKLIDYIIDFIKSTKE